MATCGGHSEQKLVRAALELVRFPRRILIGGLGVGYSLATALADCHVEHVTVVELEEAVIRWNYTYLADYSQHALDDPRTRVVCADLLEWLQHSTEKYDVICVDIDNGPSWTVNPANDALYEDAGLHLLGRRLNLGGVLAFWSAQAEPAFEERLACRFKEVRVVPVEAGRGGPDYIYLVQRQEQ